MSSDGTADGPPVVVAYNGTDGACAGAMVLLRHPDAGLVVSSARRIAQTLGEVAAREAAPAVVHVCGVGVNCAWEDLADALRGLAQRGCAVTWYCGRGYLDERAGEFSSLCMTVFPSAGTNTAAVHSHLRPRCTADAARLEKLARYDPNLEAREGEPSADERFWLDLIEACIGQYLKYQDSGPYCEAIRALAQGRAAERERTQVALHRRFGLRHVLRGRSEPMRELRRLVRLCAQADEAVLITGETGVGKEYVAHLVHEGSVRAMEPMVPVNCAVFAGNAALANSTLFGHRKGAFTGAVSDREGAFVAAHGGTLFLDEVGELSPEVQAKFLRVLEDGLITPEGADRPRSQVDVRVVAATNRDLPAMARTGRFREDLFHRLDVLRVRVPALREHVEDIPVIAQALLHRMGVGAAELSARAAAALKAFPWPGNVRQLAKVLVRAERLGTGVRESLAQESAVAAPDGGAAGVPEGMWPQCESDIRRVRDVQRDYAARALVLCGGAVNRAAEALGIAPNTLRAYLRAEQMR